MFINNLIALVDEARYLEIGTRMGSTLCSAIFGNAVRALAIDNWTEFGGPAENFLKNLANFKGGARVSFLETDLRNVDYFHIGKFNIYLFDGPRHHRQPRIDVGVPIPLS